MFLCVSPLLRWSHFKSILCVDTSLIIYVITLFTRTRVHASDVRLEACLNAAICSNLHLLHMSLAQVVRCYCKRSVCWIASKALECAFSSKWPFLMSFKGQKSSMTNWKPLDWCLSGSLSLGSKFVPKRRWLRFFSWAPWRWWNYDDYLRQNVRSLCVDSLVD